MMFNRQTACLWIALGSIAVYMLALLDVPLFFDEIALRVRVGRGFIEGFSFTSYFPECKAAALVTPWLLMPAHYTLSWWDDAMAWGAVRIVPLMVIAAVLALAAAFAQRAPNPRAVLLLCGGFVGVAGTSLILSRPEYFNLLQVAAILATLLLAQRAELKRWVALLVVALHLFVVGLSLVAHLQALLLVPFSFVACMQLLRGRRVAALVVGFLLAAACMQVFTYNAVNCPGDPALATAMRETQGSGVARMESSHNLMVRLAHRGQRYAQQFLFRTEPQAFTIPLPPVTGTGAVLVNIPVVVLVVGYTLLLLLMALVLGRDVWRRYRPQLCLRHARTLLNTLAVDGRFLLFCAASLLVVYSLYEVSGAFYRAHFRNFLTVVLFAIAAGHVVRPWAKKFITFWAVLAVLTCLASAALLWGQVVPGLKAHKAFIGVPLDQDWAARQQQVEALAKRCGLKPELPGIVVDDLTYQALKHYRQPYGFHYLWYGGGLKGTSTHGDTPTQREARVTALGLSGMLVQCQTATYVYNMPYTHRMGDLCCKAYR